MKLKLERFNRKDIYDKKLFLSNLLNLPTGYIIVQETGRFELYNLDEYQYNLAMSKLRNNSTIYNLHSNSRQDFSHFDFRSNKPKMKYNITGFIK